MHEMAATALSLRRTHWYKDRWTVGSEWEAYALNVLLRIPHHGQMIKIWGKKAFPDAVIGTTLIEIKSNSFTVEQAKRYARYIAERRLDPNSAGVELTDVTYLFLIKLSPSKEDDLRKIFAQYNVPLEINHIFDH